MAIKPFKAYHYNPAKIKDFSKVVCPPYDVISEEQQNQLHNLSPHNYIYLTLGKHKSTDDGKNNVYTRARASMNDWIKKGILIQDDQPSIYFYKQDYKVMGQQYSRLGFVALMELHDEEDSKVHPHEKTHADAVDDRLRLWKTLKSNLSSIFVCYDDRQKKVEKIFNKEVAQEEPLVDVTDQGRVRHRLWQVQDKDLIREIDSSVSGQNLFIADGHHRYKVATEIRRLRRKKKENASGLEPFNYVMTYFTNMDSKNLQIFPMHRIVKHLPKDLDFLNEDFRMDSVKNKDDLLILLAKAGLNEHAFGLYTKDGIKLLRLKNKLLIDQKIKEGSKDYKSLDATILKHFILDRVKVKSDDIKYTNDFNEVVTQVNRGQAACGFIMNAVKIDQLRSIALHGERMPPKTTYFYPKVLSGLTVYKME